MTLTPELIIASLAIILSLGVLIWTSILEHRLAKFFGKTEAGDLEEILVALVSKFEDLSHKTAVSAKNHQDLASKVAGGVSKVHTVRFSPFKSEGGHQSFATAFINDHGDGVVISSLYTREKVGIYAKPLINFSSDYELTDEELEAITKAKSQ